MKRVLFIMAISLLAVVMRGQSVSPPYVSTMFGDECGWQTVNVDENTNTWADDDYARDFSDTPYTEGKEFKDRRKQADDWLISPAVSLEAGKTYKVSFWTYVETGYDRLSLSWADAGTVEALSADGTMLYDYEEGTYDWVRNSVVISPAVSGDFFFGFHVYTEENKGYVYLTGFEISEDVFVPGPVGSLAVTPDLNGALKALVTWTLPTADIDGIALPEGADFEKVTLARDGSLIADLPGDAISFTDTAALGLTEGKHTYSVTVTINGVTSDPVEITSRHIGPLPVESLPWTAGIGNMTKDDFETYYAAVKGENSTIAADKGWTFDRWDSCIEFTPGSSVKREDDWLMLPKIRFEKAGVYRIRISAEYGSKSVNPRLALYKGDSRSIEAMTERLATFETLPYSEAETYRVFRINEPGEFCLAFYAGREESGSSTSIFLYEIAVEETELLPTAVTDLRLEQTEGTAKLLWTVPSLMNTGEPVGSFDSIRILRDDETIAELTDGILPGAEMEYSDTPGEAGMFTYSVVPVAGGKTPESEPMAVSTTWMGDKLQKLPYTLDFSEDVNLNVQKALWTILDNNGDSYTWSVKSTGLTLSFDYWDECDDMLLSPPFEIEPGNYTVILSVKGGEEDFPIQVGFVAEGDDSYTLNDPATITLNGKNSFAGHTVHLNTSVSGRHHLAFHTTAEYGYDPYSVVLGKIYLAKDNVTGIESIVDNSLTQGVYYDLNGLRIDKPRRGSVCIFRSADGSTRKVIIVDAQSKCAF